MTSVSGRESQSGDFASCETCSAGSIANSSGTFSNSDGERHEEDFQSRQSHSINESEDVFKEVPTFGLINEGYTCYLNALLQLLYHTTLFRTSVLRIPRKEESLKGEKQENRSCSGDYEDSRDDDWDSDLDSLQSSPAPPRPPLHYALQELFYLMQIRAAPNRTLRLTASFGWNQEDLRVQQDIQEMAALLRDRISEAMMGTPVEGTVDRVFGGLGLQIVETHDKTFRSCRPDEFFDIHIPINGFTELYKSLESLTASEELVGDNQYLTEIDGKSVFKDATKSYRFVQFPPVIWFHLKRFQMDVNSPSLALQKVHTPLCFPPVLDLSKLEHREASKFLNEEDLSRLRKSIIPEDSSAVYDLYGVVVHRGSASSGHYFCYVHEWDDEKLKFRRWLKYDDTQVEVVGAEKAIEENYSKERAWPSPLKTSAGSRFNSPLRNSSSTSGFCRGRGTLSRSRKPEREVHSPLYNVYDKVDPHTSAYILAYVRRDVASTIFAEINKDDITPSLCHSVQRELEREAHLMRMEQERRESLFLYFLTNRRLAECTAECTMKGFQLVNEASSSFSSPSSSNLVGPLHYPVELALRLRKSDLLQNVYETLAQQPCFLTRGLGAHQFRLWLWDPFSAIGALADRSWNRASCKALPIYEECQRHTVAFSHFIARSESHRPLEIYLYVEEPTPFLSLLPTLHMYPLVKRFQCIEPGTYKIGFRHAIHEGVISLVLGARHSSAKGDPTCAVELQLLQTSTGWHARKPRTAYPVSPVGGALIVEIPLPLMRGAEGGEARVDDITLTVVEESNQRSSSGAMILLPWRVTDMHIRLQERSLPSSSGSSDYEKAYRVGGESFSPTAQHMMSLEDVTSIRKSTTSAASSTYLCTPQIPQTGTDRILVFFKLFDTLTDTMRYLGSALMDRFATVQSCAVLVQCLMGFPIGGHQSLLKQPLSFFLEESTGGFVELDGMEDLWHNRLSCGSILVTQIRSIPPVYRYSLVSSIPNQMGSVVLVSILEFSCQLEHNENRVLKALRAFKESHSTYSDKRKKRKSDNPYELELPCFQSLAITIVQHVTAFLSRQWSYLSLCEAIGDALNHNPNYLELYYPTDFSCSPFSSPAYFPSSSLSGSLPANPNSSRAISLLPIFPHEDGRFESEWMSPQAEGVQRASSFSSPQLPIQRLPHVRSHKKEYLIPITLRDEKGNPQFRQMYTLGSHCTAGEVVRTVLDSVPSWVKELNPFGSFPALCEKNHHFILVIVDDVLHRILQCVEVPAKREDLASIGELLEPHASCRRLSLYVQRCSQLVAGERRFACCGVSIEEINDFVPDVGSIGQSFIVTMHPTTTVIEALEVILKAICCTTRILHPPPKSILRLYRGLLEVFPQPDRAIGASYTVLQRECPTALWTVALNYKKDYFEDFCLPKGGSERGNNSEAAPSSRASQQSTPRPLYLPRTGKNV